MLGLQLNLCGIYSVADLVGHLRTDPNALATLLDAEYTHTPLATTTVMADAETQADVLQVAAPPLPPPVNVVLQVAVPAVPTVTVGTETASCRMRNAQAQTARSLAVGTTTAVQTVTTALSMVDGSTTTAGSIFTASISTDAHLDRAGSLSHTSMQTDGSVVTASDHHELGKQLVASICQAQQAAKDLAEEKAALDGLVTAIINRKRIEMNGARYNVWCEGEAEAAGEPRDGVYVLPSRPLVLG